MLELMAVGPTTYYRPVKVLVLQLMGDAGFDGPSSVPWPISGGHHWQCFSAFLFINDIRMMDHQHATSSPRLSMYIGLQQVSNFTLLSSGEFSNLILETLDIMT
ncbi:hypothetical protein HAX54_022325 [Datura stramonium]|uniref:Uncharacterized protein n=1 Tax=Datura stramonium TaxID=4076 RepID=A0ABS8UWG8_DATST|nr:hypothetical protein [Datura stramonium]